MKSIAFTLNGGECALEVRPNRTLLEVLHEDLGLPGTKNGCSQGVCGACTVLLDGEPVRACLTLAVRVRGRRVTTVEGLATNGALHPLQAAFVEHGAVQCGFCTPGMLMAAAAFLRDHPRPQPDEVREALVGNLCRCTGYTRIVRAVMSAAEAQSGA